MTTKEKNTETMFTIAVGFVFVSLISGKEWVLYISLVAGLAGIFSDYISSKIAWAWFKLGELMNMVFPKIILTVVFYIFLLPIAFLSRIGSKDPMKLKKGYSSYYSDRTTEFKKEDFEKTW